DHSNDAGEVHKSYQSTVYPVSSFMLALREVDPGNREKYDLWINTLLEIATSKIVEQKKQVVTCWLYERFASDFSVDPSYVMSEAGHITQLSWVLSEALAEGIVTDPKKQESYRRISRALLEKFLEHDGISEATGC